MLIYLLFCTSFSLGKGIRLVCFAFLPEDHLPVLCGEAAEGSRPDFQRYQMLADTETQKIFRSFLPSPHELIRTDAG